ncbi:hypothetical protein L208DRAFT_1251107, partial [Tricholoma matsutake]
SEVALIVENSLLRPEIVNAVIGRYRVDDTSQSSTDSLHTIPDSPAFSAPPFSPNVPPSNMNTSECLNVLESDITRIRAQIDSLESTIENFIRTLQTSSMSNIPPIAPPSAPNNDVPPNVPTKECTQIKPSPPAKFNGVRVQGHAFLNSCELYISLQLHQFINEAAKIYWAFTYMKSERAYLYVDRILCQTKELGSLPFSTWGDF